MNMPRHISRKPAQVAADGVALRIRSVAAHGVLMRGQSETEARGFRRESGRQAPRQLSPVKISASTRQMQVRAEAARSRR